MILTFCVSRNKVKSVENYCQQVWLEIIHLIRKQMFWKTNISYSMIRTCPCACAYQGIRNVSSSENFAYVLNELLQGFSESKFEQGITSFAQYPINWIIPEVHLGPFNKHIWWSFFTETVISCFYILSYIPQITYIFKVNDKNTKKHVKYVQS